MYISYNKSTVLTLSMGENTEITSIQETDWNEVATQASTVHCICELALAKLKLNDFKGLAIIELRCNGSCVAGVDELSLTLAMAQWSI